MTAFQRFEDILAWQKARELANLVYRLTNSNRLKKDYVLRDQLRRAGVSPMLNIAEGFGRNTQKEFYQFLVIARGSVVETQSIAYLISGLGYISGDEFNLLMARAKECEKLITALAKSLKAKPKP